MVVSFLGARSSRICTEITINALGTETSRFSLSVGDDRLRDTTLRRIPCSNFCLVTVGLSFLFIALIIALSLIVLILSIRFLS